jgi:hypothetical protein
VVLLSLAAVYLTTLAFLDLLSSLSNQETSVCHHNPLPFHLVIAVLIQIKIDSISTQTNLINHLVSFLDIPDEKGQKLTGDRLKAPPPPLPPSPSQWFGMFSYICHLNIKLTFI